MPLCFCACLSTLPASVFPSFSLSPSPLDLRYPFPCAGRIWQVLTERQQQRQKRQERRKQRQELDELEREEFTLRGEVRRAPLYKDIESASRRYYVILSVMKRRAVSPEAIRAAMDSNNNKVHVSEVVLAPPASIPPCEPLHQSVSTFCVSRHCAPRRRSPLAGAPVGAAPTPHVPHEVGLARHVPDYLLLLRHSLPGKT